MLDALKRSFGARPVAADGGHRRLIGRRDELASAIEDDCIGGVVPRRAPGGLAVELGEREAPPKAKRSAAATGAVRQLELRLESVATLGDVDEVSEPGRAGEQVDVERLRQTGVSPSAFREGEELTG